MSFRWNASTSAICSLLALDQALEMTSEVNWVSRPQILIDLATARKACENKDGKTTEQKIQDAESYTKLLVKVMQEPPSSLNLNFDSAGNIALQKAHGSNRYTGSKDMGSSASIERARQSMAKLCANYRQAFKTGKEELDRQEKILDELSSELSKEEVQARRANLRAEREALEKAHAAEKKKIEEEIKKAVEELGGTLKKPTILSRKTKYKAVHIQIRSK